MFLLLSFVQFQMLWSTVISVIFVNDNENG